MMISDLSGDLESEILSRVPAKSLVKFRGTCKRWYALFKDPKFAKKNQGKSARELILLKNFRVYSVIVNRHGIHKGIDPSMEFRGKLNTLKDSKDYKISEIFQYEDLILCVTKGNTRLVVWNPCTGETRWIKPSSVNRRNYLYALGYGNSNSNSSCRSYKILRFCRYQNDQKLLVTEFEMYEFSSDSWRVLDGFTDNWCLSSRGVSLKENAYWIALDKEIGYFLLSFDFTTERFERLPLPYESHNWEDTAVLSVVKDERLSVLYQSISVFTAMMKIWVTNKIADTKDMSWSNFLVVDFEKFMLPCVTNVISFFLDEENKVAVCCDKDMDFGDIAGGERTRIYIVGEDIYKEAYKETTKETLWNWSLFVSYVPSLVHIEENTLKRQKKMNEKEVGTGSHLRKKH